MPARKRVFRKRKPAQQAKRRVFKRYRRRVRKIGSRVSQLPSVAPVRLQTKLNYEEVMTVSSTAPSTAYADFRLASAYDPQYNLVGFTGTGPTSNGQPGWFDAVKGWYRAYIIRGVKLKFTFTPNSTETAHIQYITSSSADGPISTTLDWGSLRAAYSGSVVVGTNASRSVTRSMYIDNYKIIGATSADSKLSQNNPLTTAIAGNPTLTPYFQVQVNPADGSGTVTGIFKISMVFYIEFFDRKLVPGDDT